MNRRPRIGRLAVRLLLLAAVTPSQQDAVAQTTATAHEHVAVDAPFLTPARETSGTAWSPLVTPMYGLHEPWRGWDLRLDGVLFAQAIVEPGDRHRTGGAGTRQGGSLNWLMFGARRNAAGGRFGLRTMFSAEPWTVPKCGSLSFLATGEVCDGDTIHDRQQPHDLLMELAADYDRPLHGGWRWQLYAALAGEPALGPPAYSHRASAMVNPWAPVTQHWLDATHGYGIVTLGLYDRRWKAEASAFNGRAPDESRVDVDLGAFDSVGTSQSRETLSGVRSDTTSAAFLVESRLTRDDRDTLFARGEIGGIPAHHLHAVEFSTAVFPIGKAQVGYVRHLPTTKGLLPGLGGTFALSVLPPALAPRYSRRMAPSVGVFFSLQAGRHAM